ncbi:hypothetical protein AHMF7605_11300 [Adhaeribacter arboris]|uniref:Uncharacterized protein n=1 Tax=Adhaeribacter arboris TaxID=2072846 RepID=A0A2T2YEY6_9BACT|nr:hypothetical protein [Adhaeribacter arboris]PSR54064.1 hypothetical protein AHMF7605_11300 [Adhaeribacter arboris]
MATTKQFSVSSTTILGLAQANANAGLLPLNARKGKVYEITEEDIQRVDRLGNIGAIRGLQLASSTGKIHSKYTCTLEAADENAKRILIKKGPRKGEEFPVPSFEETEDSFIIELVPSTVS